jgi:hypothetical protein
VEKNKNTIGISETWLDSDIASRWGETGHSPERKNGIGSLFSWALQS